MLTNEEREVIHRFAQPSGNKWRNQACAIYWKHAKQHLIDRDSPEMEFMSETLSPCPDYTYKATLRRRLGVVGVLLAGLLYVTAISLAVPTPAHAQCGPISSIPTDTQCGMAALDNESFNGGDNSAYGASSLASNITGVENTAIGITALARNQDGYENTATGANALVRNTGGFGNTATGAFAMGLSDINSLTGTYNTASGVYALETDTTGSNNVATGAGAAQNTTMGSNNTAEGVQALYSNMAGSSNVALGDSALKNSTSSNNIAVGNSAGRNIGRGGNNIEIGSQGTASDSGTIRIGSTQTATYIAGIVGTTVTNGSPVLIDNTGKLGVFSTAHTASLEQRLAALEARVTQLEAAKGQ